MKYPDITIQIKYPNKLINADTPLVKTYESVHTKFRDFAMSQSRNI